MDESLVSCGPTASSERKGTVVTKPKPTKRTNSDGIRIPQPTTGQTVTCSEPTCKARNQQGLTCSVCGGVLPTGINLPDGN